MRKTGIYISLSFKCWWPWCFCLRFSLNLIEYLVHFGDVFYAAWWSPPVCIFQGRREFSPPAFLWSQICLCSFFKPWFWFLVKKVDHGWEKKPRDAFHCADGITKRLLQHVPIKYWLFCSYRKPKQFSAHLTYPEKICTICAILSLIKGNRFQIQKHFYLIDFCWFFKLSTFN